MIKILPFDTVDFDTLISWINNEEMLMQFSGPTFTFPLTKQQLHLNSEDKKRSPFKIVDVLTNSMIGYSEIYLQDKNTAILSRIIIGNSKFRGRGIGQEIVKNLLEVSFNQYKVEKTELYVFDWNVNAIKCYEKAGFIINPDKIKKREINRKIWTALNMVVEKYS